MVCKKSLYCWKNGPCASFQTRKKIWEDNIKFRESLRDVNQSDHYWSFQISKNLCLCQDNEEVSSRKPFCNTYNNSVHNLHENDCTSIAHDYNGLKYRNCLVHCPFQNFTKVIENDRVNDRGNASELSIKKQSSLNCTPNQCRFLQKVNTNKSELCSRCKNILLDSTLKPNIKKKFSSQSNLDSINDFQKSSNMAKKTLNFSCENICRTSDNTCNSLKSTKKVPSQLNLENKQTNKVMLENKKEKIKCKKENKLNPVKFVKNEKLFKLDAPMSQTTRKILKGNKKAPFLPYGCNNKCNDMGAKKTHNVLASELEVYPNALSAQRQKQKLILKHMQYEKEFQRKCFSNSFKKEIINHSSLWSRELTGKENKLLQEKTAKKILPTLCRNSKKLCAEESRVNSRVVKTNIKPQIYFY